MITEAQVREIAADLSISMIGITTAEPLTVFQKYLENRAETPFCHISPEKRINFKGSFEKAETVIVIGLPYLLRQDTQAGMKSCGKLAAFCLERDYHQRVREKLTALAENLKKEEDFEYKIFVDQAQLIDRASAWRAGLGFFGKNNLLIHPQYGSAFVIGQLLISEKIDFKPAVPMDSQCGACRKCLDICPNHALGDGYDLIAKNCIAYLTQKKKLSEEERQKLKTWLYGCDFCQLVCPFNIDLPDHVQFSETLLEPQMDLEAVLNLSEEAFKDQFKDTALFWRGRAVLARNAAVLFNRKSAKPNGKE